MSLNACNVFSRVIAEIDVDIESAIYQQGICGLSISLVQGNRTFWSKGYGYTDRSQREKVSPETLFSIQSIGKTFTATTFMIMASNGQIGLDDPIRMHYPEFTINTMGSEADIDKITFRRMLSHWAGFTHEATLGNNYDDTSHTYLEHIESIKDNWLRSTPGSEYSYSNIGYDLTGYVMGRKMDKTFPETVQDAS